MTEDEMVGWHYRLNGHEFEQALGVGDRQGSLACCSPWGHKESDTTERLNSSSKFIHCTIDGHTSGILVGAVVIILLWTFWGTDVVFLLSPGLGVGQEDTGCTSSPEYVLPILQSSAMADSSSV